jgi:phage terminase large subunit GpA-like protein
MKFTVDLTKIEGDGAFPCPQCGTIISPDDESDTIYNITESKLKNDELSELVITCNKCKAVINLTGFQFQEE